MTDRLFNFRELFEEKSYSLTTDEPREAERTDPLGDGWEDSVQDAVILASALANPAMLYQTLHPLNECGSEEGHVTSFPQRVQSPSPGGTKSLL